MAGYRAPTAPTRYFVTRNEVIAGDADDEVTTMLTMTTTMVMGDTFSTPRHDGARW